MLFKMTIRRAVKWMSLLRIPHVKITSGYYVSVEKTYILCRCDGNTVPKFGKCKCGARLWICMDCYDKGLIQACPTCTSKYEKWRRLQLAMEEFRRKMLHLTDGDFAQIERDLEADEE